MSGKRGSSINGTAVWFLHRPDRMVATWTKTLVDVDRPWPHAEQHELRGQLNQCVRADHIRMRVRTDAQRAAFIQALGRRRADSFHRRLTTAAPNRPV
jgi:hypothetical protein